MTPTWTFTAQSYFDQLSPAEKSDVEQAVDRLPAEWEALDGNRLNRLAGDQNDLYALRVGSDLRVLLQRRDKLITVIDVVQKGQIDGLRRNMAARHVVPG